MSQTKVKKGFDALAFKDAAQARIIAETRGMTHAEEIAYFQRKASTGHFAKWYKAAVRTAEARRAAEKQTKP